MKKYRFLIIGLLVFVVLVVGGIALFGGFGGKEAAPLKVVGAVGGGKENFLADEEIAQILRDEYGIELELVSWSNGRLTDENLAADGEHKYDFVFFSDQRYYEQYQAANNQTYKKQKGFIALNTPIVCYSWRQVVDALVEQGIATQKNGVYYLTDMSQLLSLMEARTPWADLTEDSNSPLKGNHNPVNIISVDPVTSSPGATYYGLLAAILDPTNRTGNITQTTLDQLAGIYEYAGFMTFTPADLFDQYLRTGMGSYPLIVDYEKSLIDFATGNPTGYNQVKDRIAVLYPEPTIWNSHCIISFNDNGSIYLDALEQNERIQQIAFERYGFRMGLSTAYANTSTFRTGQGEVQLTGIPPEIYSVVPSLRMEGYNKIVEALKASVGK